MDSGPRRISKSAFKDGKRCPKRLWFRWNAPDLATSDEAMLARAALGHEIGQLARGLNPGGVESAGDTTALRLESTRSLLAGGAETIYEAAFEADGLYAQVDILYRGRSGWVIREVKSAKSVNDQHVTDSAFQLMVLERSGLSVERVEIVTVALDAPAIASSRIQDLFAVQDVTGPARGESIELFDQVRELRAIIEDGRAEAVEPGRHCDSACPFYSHCFAALPDDDLLFAPNLSKGKYEELRAAGYRRMSELPDSLVLSPNAEHVRQVLASGQVPWVDAGLAKAVSGMKFPLVFLDFETASPLFPVNPGMRGGELVVFQFSAHVLSGPGGPLAHYEHIDLESPDPHPGVVAALAPVFSGAGSILHYSPFEKRCLNRLVAAGVEGANGLLGQFLRSAVDMEGFFKGPVYHPAMRGKTSIKVVLPALVPDLDYSDLEIKSGGMAEMSYIEARTGKLAGDELNRRREALLRYCERDTEAMVRLFNRIWELCR
ncbi:MAG: DUF2779 domain-containing protein [Armatimonadetes bacterium]|nr:DUF2779 domain-containing protein [Armatimonadota bacterium]MBX3109354.1 DUF2779 domain-containing protein [Fimbriimonadaceae bacterium]